MNRACFIAVVSLLAGGPAHAKPVESLVNQADMILRGATSAGVLDMQIKTATFDRTYKIVIWDDGRGEGRTLIKILGPAMWRGFATLKLGASLKLYNARTNHVTVVSQSMLGDNWMGSHFTNDDLVKETRLARDFLAHLVRTWPGPGPRGEPVTFHQIELTPKPTAPVPWGKIIFEVWEQGDTVMPVQAQYFRKAGSPSPERTLSFSDVKELGGRLVPSRLLMTVAAKPNEFTAIDYRTLRLNISIPDTKFSEQALRE